MKRTFIYIPTDSNEVRGIVEQRKLGRDELVEDYFYSKDKIKSNGLFKKAIITNIPSIDSNAIQEREGLRFSPASIISGKLTQRDLNNLVSLLKQEGLIIATKNKGQIEHHFPTKYEGYQGGGFY